MYWLRSVVTAGALGCAALLLPATARAAMVVASGAEVRQLRNANMVSNLDVDHIIKPRLLPDPTMVADGQPPRKLDAHVRLDDDSASNARPEQTQHSHLETAHWQPAPFKEDQAAEVPQRPHNATASRIEVRVFVAG